ncbi:MAG: hypothetical protein Q8O42_15150 [Acidobacteriota bacterium]|nr:hypothetical protein [Acidobacteriota bacterium]
MSHTTLAVYQADARWQIVSASEWEWRPSTFNQVWDFDAEQLAKAS